MPRVSGGSGERRTGRVEARVGQHAPVEAVKDPLRLHILARQEAVPLRRPVHHLRACTAVKPAGLSYI